MLGPFEFLILSTAHCAVTRELTLRRRIGAPIIDQLTSEQRPGEPCVSMKLVPRDGGFALCVIGHRGWKQHYLESFRKHFFLFQVKFPKYSSSISQAGAFLALFSSFQREMVCLRLIPQHGFISFSCWDVLARSSPLVYWLQTICDCRGIWLLSLQKQEVQSIHERHRTFIFFFLLKNVYLFLPAFLGTKT